ncbi:MAG TPA: hypothetical protein EYQ83_08060 [Acidobacteria bacterium]|nr:hypothetical protein [Acidobacteriota bacterium]
MSTTAPALMLVLATLVLAGTSPVLTAQTMPVVMTVGCVEMDGRDGVLLTRATDPTAIDERAPDQPPSDAPLGAETLTLVGTLEEFGVANHEGHKVWVKGLLNPAAPHPLLNLTSITHLSPSCD